MNGDVEPSSSTMETDERDDTVRSILDSVSHSDGFFRSQQVGEADLTVDQKRQIASELLAKSPPLFLERYWKFIKPENLGYFESLEASYEVEFYVSEARRLHGGRSSQIRVKNRRYEAMRRLVEAGSYFSDTEMRKRRPYLYDRLVGRHLTEKERLDSYKEEHKDDRFSSFLLDQMERNVENNLFDRQKHEDECIIEEDDSDSEESELESDEEPKVKITPDEDKCRLRNEFTNIMYESFLDGKDKDFDYSAVDDNTEYDSLHQRELDEEEKYFDQESPEESTQ